MILGGELGVCEPDMTLQGSSGVTSEKFELILEAARVYVTGSNFRSLQERFGLFVNLIVGLKTNSHHLGWGYTKYKRSNGTFLPTSGRIDFECQDLLTSDLKKD